MTKNLFDIQTELAYILEELEQYFLDNPDAEGEIPEHINERLFVNKNEASDKLTNMYLWRLELEGQIVSLKARIDNLTAKVRTKNKVIEMIKNYTNNAVKMYGEINLKSKAAIKSKVVLGDDVKFTYIYTPKLLVDPITISRKYLLNSLEVVNMKEKELDALLEYLKGRELSIESLSAKANKDLIEAELKEGKKIEGVQLDNEAGHVRTS